MLIESWLKAEQRNRG